MDKIVDTWTVIVRRGNNLNVTLSTIWFDKWGASTKQETIIVDEWKDGVDRAIEKGHKSALFVDSGTVFVDWPKWKSLLDNYPHKGLIAHIIHHPGQFPYLDQQCWFMDLTLDINSVEVVTYPTPLRSDKNLHDDYTPLWVKPGTGSVTHPATLFGQTLIAQQLNRGNEIVNWTSAARDLKRFCYKELDFDIFRDYINLAENQFWIFNNESIDIVDKEKIVCPGSGLFWILNIVSPLTKQVQIVDISLTQIEFCKKLWAEWTGVDYGSFVVDFINLHALEHYELDIANLSPVERLKLKNQSFLRDYINNKFQSILDQVGLDQSRFREKWISARTSKMLTVEKGNLVEWVIDNIKDQDHLWASNILNYKWTMLHTTESRANQFREMIKSNRK